MPVATVFENLEAGLVEEVMDEFDVRREQLNSLLEFVARSLEAPTPVPVCTDSSIR